MRSGFRIALERIGIAAVVIAGIGMGLARGLTWMLRNQPQPAIDILRRVFGHVLNPLFLGLSKRLPVDQTVLYHVGRKSGREYVTPLCVSATPAGFILPAAFGPGVDWLANLKETPRTRLRHEGIDHDVEAEIIDYEQALAAAAGGPHCPCWEQYRVENYALLRPIGGGGALSTTTA